MTRSLLAYFSLTFLVSWTMFMAAAVISGGTASPSLGPAGIATPVFLIGVFAPALVALALTARAEGYAGTMALLGRTGEWPAKARWFVIAAGYMAAIRLGAAVAHRLVIGEWPAFGQTPVILMVGALIISTPVQAGEEIGWRGYALPRLARRVGLGPASILLGVIWACWHLPLFFIPGTDTTGQSFPAYLLSVTALSVAMAWLYWRTNASLLLTMLMHAAINNTKDIVPAAGAAGPHPFHLNASAISWLTAALLWICAACFLARMRGATLEQALQPAASKREAVSLG